MNVFTKPMDLGDPGGPATPWDPAAPYTRRPQRHPRLWRRCDRCLGGLAFSPMGCGSSAARVLGPNSALEDEDDDGVGEQTLDAELGTGQGRSR